MEACPSDDQLVRMVEGGLAHGTLSHIEMHVDRCEHCASVIAGLGALGPEATHDDHPRGEGRPDHPGLGAVDPDDYVVEEEIARGGMGRILRARDRRLGRQIAIKENLGRSDEHGRRFEREARITARLQHPSIVQIHEAGVWPGGTAFFAMQLVAGRSFDKVIAEATTLDQRLALVPNALAVADAIAYAHNQGVLHRDLKPQNVIIGEFGETVVIDWGLAKELSADEAPFDEHTPVRELAIGTEAGKVMGTPAYMSPEQARGKALDLRADVYALGALLFHMLAGRPPVTGRTTDEVLAKVIAGPAPSLAEVQPEVPADLLAIVAKAIAFAPEDRYPSARELAADLRRFQTGKLVAAHHYSPAQLVRRWLRRHRTAVSVGLAALVVLVAIGAFSVRQVIRAEAVAQTERHAAEQHQLAAERHRANAEELMAFMLGDLREKLERIGKLDLLDLVATKAVAYYEQRPEGASVTDRRARAIALDNLGSVLLAQGHTVQGIAMLRSALAISVAIAAEDPADAHRQRDLAIKHTRLGDGLLRQGDIAGALAESRADLAITTKLAAREPSNAQFQRDLSVSHEKLGDLLTSQGKSAEALAEYRASLAISATLAAAAPSDVNTRDLSVGHERIGEVLAGHGDVEAALVEQRAGLELRAQLVARDRTNAVWQLDLAGSHNNVGELLVTQGKLAEARTEYAASSAILEELTARDPNNTDWRSLLAVTRTQLGKILLQDGKVAEALAEFHRSLTIEEALAAEDPTNPDRQRDVEVTRKRLGDGLRVQGQLAAALAEYQRAAEIGAKLAARDPSNAAWQRDLANGYEKIGLVHELTGDWKRALDDYRASLAVRDTLIARDPTNGAWQSDAAASHFNIGEVLATHDLAGALVEQRAALAITEKLVAHDPTNASWQHDVADSHDTIGDLLLRQGDRPAALAEFRTALAMFEKLGAAEDAAKLRRKLR